MYWSLMIHIVYSRRYYTRVGTYPNPAMSCTLSYDGNTRVPIKKFTGGVLRIQEEKN